MALVKPHKALDAYISLATITALKIRECPGKCCWGIIWGTSGEMFLEDYLRNVWENAVGGLSGKPQRGACPDHHAGLEVVFSATLVNTHTHTHTQTDSF